jgi:nucleotide-binding universal stress UspA family protein
MVLKDILVHMDTLPQAAAGLEAALVLAGQHGAQIVGLHVITHSLLEDAESKRLDDLQQVRELFLQKTSQAGIKAVWECIDVKTLQGSVAEVVNHQAAFADMVIVGQTREKWLEADLPERVVLGSGKPVLIIPYSGVFPSVGRNVLVAWKSGRESSRALSDALPLLRQADSVSIFEVNPTTMEQDDMKSLAVHLERHGVHARLETSQVTELPVGDILLNRLADEGSDLLVMGAYAHNSFGTYVLGDVARHIMKHMTVPVLMSH